MSKFKIQGVGLDTTKLDYSPGEEMEFDYLYTSILANNEEAIYDYVSRCSGSPLVTRLSFLDRSSEAIGLHLDQLGRATVDLLLVDASCDFIKYADDLSSLVDYKYVDVIGVYGPETPERLDEIKTVLPNLKYIGLELSPLNFNYEVVKWAKDNGVDIVGFNPFGGNISAQGMIDSFTVPYLLEFFGTHTTLGFLSSRDMFSARQDKDYLEKLIGRDIENPKLYNLEKSMYKLYKPIKKAIGVSLKLDLNHTLPLGFSDSLFDPSDLDIRFGEALTETRDLDVVVGGIEDEVYEYYREFKTPEDTESDLAILALFRPHVKDLLISRFPGWIISENRAGEKIFVYSAVYVSYRGHGIFKRIKETKTRNFLLQINNKSLEFCEIFVPENNESAEQKELDS